MWPLWLLLAHGAALLFLLAQAFAGHDFGGSVRRVDGNDLIIEVATFDHSLAVFQHASGMRPNAAAGENEEIAHRSLVSHNWRRHGATHLVAVRTPVTGRPPRGSVRAAFPHTAPTLGV